MDKKSQTRLIFGILLISIFSLSFVLGSGGGENPIGYKIYDNTLEIWNTQATYYFNKTSGIQFTNHFQDYWTRNIFCIGYYSGDEWVKIKCADELGEFNRDIKTDNETYVNATLWKWITLNIEGNEYPFRFGLRYHLGLNDEKLSIIIQGKNGAINIPYDLGFAWKVTDWEIPHDNPLGDSIFINDTDYDLDGTFDLLFKNMTHIITPFNETTQQVDELIEPIPFFRGYDWTKFLRVDWNKNLNYAVKMYSNGNQEDFYVALLINAGKFNSTDEKSTTFYWIDAEGDYTGVHWDTSAITNPTKITTDGTNFWVIDYSATERIYKYNMTGGYVDDWEIVEADTPFGIATDGNYYWVAEHTGAEVYKYNLDGSYTTDHFDLSVQGIVFADGIATDGNFIWVSDSSSENRFYKYEMDGTYISNFSLAGTFGGGGGLGTDGNFIWSVNRIDDKAYKYYMNGTYTGFNFSVSGEMTYPQGGAVYGGYIWFQDTPLDEVFQYEGEIVDSTSPNVTINQPTNITYSTNTIIFNVTALDETNMTNGGCWISIDDGITNLTLLNTTHNDQYNATNTTVPDGSYHTQVWCNDTYNNVNNTEQVTFNIISDSIPPQTSTPIITPSQPKTTDNLKCNATLTDDKQTSLTAYWKWYKNNVSYLSGETAVTNGTLTIITTLNSTNTSKEENWKCEVLPYDGNNYGNATNSTPVIILNTDPTHNQPLLTTSTGKNLSTENLTCYNQSTSDADGDSITNIYNWYKDGQPLLSLNLPFEGGSNSSYTKDYSGYGNNDGTVSNNAVWKSSGGYNGKGAYDVTLNGATITIPHKAEVNPTDEITVMAWIKYNDTYCDSNYGGSAARPIAKGQNEAFELQTYEWINGKCTARFCVNATCPDLGVTSETEKGNWAHITGSFNGTHINTYFNGDLDVSIEYSGKIPFITDDLIIGDWTPNFGRGFIGIIDEVMIFDHALSAEQIKTLYEGKTNLIVSQETSGGDDYMCQVTPNDGEVDGNVLNSTELSVLHEITFNVTDSFSNKYLNSVTINCDSPGFSQGGDTTNTYGPYGFSPGSYTCTFELTGYYDKTIIFTADNDKIVSVPVSERAEMTIEEHTWLEAIYNCISGGDCSLYNLLLEINQTTSNIWEHTKPTDESVITSETITNKVVNSTNNLSIDYTVNIPIKAGYSLGAYLPVRIGFWFLNENNETCYNQGDKPTGVEEPYCQPLIVETIGPMGGSVDFTVELRPSLPAGNYSIKRIIDIDPLGVWYNYGQETIGMFTLTESLIDSYIGLEKTGEVMPETSGSSSSDSSSTNSESSSSSGSRKTIIIKEREIITFVPQNSEDKDETEELINLNKPGITGGAIGAYLLSGGQITFILVVLCGTFIIFIIVRNKTSIKLKKK